MTKPKSDDEKIVWVYRGPGRFGGIPDRSLTQAEFDALPFLQQQTVIDSTIYVQAEAQKPATNTTTQEGGEDA